VRTRGSGTAPVGRPRRARRRPFRRRDDGSMAVEVVLMTPILVMFMLFVVALGRMVWVRGQIESATRDAVRAATLERNIDDALREANEVADLQTQNRDCDSRAITGNFQPGGTITYTMRCEVSFDELGLIGLPGSDTITFSSDAPLDQFRRTD